MSRAKVTPLMRLSELTVQYPARRGTVDAVCDVDLDLIPGRVLSVIGESGSGKSTVLLAIAGLLPPRAQVSGKLALAGRTGNLLTDLSARADIAGRTVGMIFQNPGASLNPVLTVGDLIDEVVQVHRGLPKTAAREETLSLLSRVGIGDARARAAAYPHQLSGGLKQRIAIAAALAGKPRLILADEPTTALDTTVQAQILDLLLDLVDKEGLGLVLVTHDIGVAGSISDEIAVMFDGRVVEHGIARDVTATPTHPHTAALAAGALPLDLSAAQSNIPSSALTARSQSDNDGQSCRRLMSSAQSHPILLKESAQFPVFQGLDDRLQPDANMTGLVLRGITRIFGTGAHRNVAADGVDLTVRAGKTVALVGESGSGKTTLARIAVGLDQPDFGTVTLNGRPLTDARGRMDRTTRAKLQMVFQDPLASFTPHRSIGASIEVPLRIQSNLSARTRRERVLELLDSVGLDKCHAVRSPAALSGGQLQRAAIARALATDPELLICDEPVASLDVSVRAQVLDLLAKLQRDRGLGILFVSHDLGVVQWIADRTVVLYLGRVVEEGQGKGLWQVARHPYTRSLAAANPTATVPWRKRPVDEQARGEAAGPFAIPSGCRFHPRCRAAVPRCKEVDPSLKTLEPDHCVACLRAGELASLG